MSTIATPRVVRLAVTPHGLRTREALLEAGREIAEREGLRQISVAAVASQAGVAKGTFYVHFADREEFVEALRADFDTRIAAAVSRAVEGKEPGRRRLLAGLTAYLDGCLADRAIKALIRDSRAGDAGREAFAQVVEPNVRAMGWRDVRAASRLIVAMTAEVALIEHAAGSKDAPARQALRRLLERADLSAGP